MMKRMKAWIAMVSVGALLLQTVSAGAPDPAWTAEKAAMAEDAYIEGMDEAAVPAELVGELTELREAAVKYYRRSDGAVTAAVYDEPVHYEEDGVFVDIDNTLVAAKSGGRAVYMNKANGLKVELPAALDATAAVTVRSQGYALSWMAESLDSSLRDGRQAKAAAVEQPLSEAAWAEAAAERVEAALAAEKTEAAAEAKAKLMTSAQAAALSDARTEARRIEVENEEMLAVNRQASAVTYGKALAGGADLRYDVRSNQLKESIVLPALPVQREFAFTIAAEGLEAVLNGDGSVSFYAADAAEDGEPVFVIAAPYMFDDAGAYSAAVAVTLEETTGGYRYALTPDRAWLEDAARVWPVTVDPTVEPYLDWKDSDAAYISEASPTGTYNNERLIVGATSAQKEYRTYYWFKVPANIDAAQRVIDARVRFAFKEFNTTGSSGVQINLHRVTSAWSQHYYSWNGAYANGNNYSATVTDFTMSNNTVTNNTYVPDYFDITGLVEEWSNNEALNYGFMLKVDDKSCNKLVTYHSENIVDNISNPSQALIDNLPTVTITYRDSKGLEDHWTYTSLSAGDTTASVNNYNGHLVVTKPIAGVDGNRMPVGISMVYNEFQRGHAGTDNLIMNAGVGWQTNFHMRIMNTSITHPDLFAKGYHHYLIDADGTEHYFKQDGSVYRDEDNLGLTLDTSTGQYVVKSKDGLTYIFSRNALLSISDSNDNSLTVAYAEPSTGRRINYISDGAGRRYTFGYNAYNSITSITDPAGRVTTFSYASSYLASITDPYGDATAFTYASTSVPGYGMTKITAPDGSRIDIRQREGSNGAYTDAAAYTAATYSKKMLRVTRLTTYGTSGGMDMQYNFTLKHNALDVTAYSKGTAAANKVGDMQYQFNNWGQTTCVVDRLSGMAQYYEQGKPKDSGKTDGTENKVTSVSKAHSSVVNLVKDGEYNSGLTYHSMTRVNTNATVTAHSTYGYMNKRSLRFYQPSTGTPGYLYGYQYIQGLPAGTYTVSAYVSTNNGQLTGGAGVGLALNVYSASGTYLRSMPSEYVTKTGANEWRRVWATIQVNAGEELRIFPGYKDGTIGTAYIDGLQAEPGETVNHYNLLSNSSNFHGATGWTYVHSLYDANDSEMSGLPGGGAAMGTPGNVIYTVLTDVNGVKGDTYSFGSWGRMIGGAPSTNSSFQRVAGYDTSFKVTVLFRKSGNTVETQQAKAEYNSYTGEWQFVSGQIIAKEAYDAVHFNLRYDRNIGKAVFARPFLYKETFGNSYAYDKNGNLISTSDLNDINSTYAYNNDDMAKLTNPSGSQHFYTSKNHLVETSHSSSGQRSDFTYDSNGNATKAVTTKQKPVTALQTGVQYVIRNAQTGNTIDSGGTTLRASIKNYRWVDTANQRWTLSKPDSINHKYMISLAQTPTLSIDIDGYSTSDDALIQIFTTNSKNSQHFMIEPTGDGKFWITAVVSNKRLDAMPAANSTTENNVKIVQRTADNTKESQKWYVYEYKTVAELNAAGYIQTNAGYSADGNYMTSLTNERGKTTTYAYNTLKGRLNSATDPRSVVTNYTYDSDDRLSKLSTVNGAYTAAVEYKYDANNYLTGIWHNNNLVRYALGYDQYRRRTSVKVGNAAGTQRTLASYLYNNLGLLDTMTYGNGWKTKTTYDALGRVSKTQYNTSANGSTFTDAEAYVYNADGQVGIYKDHVANQRTRYTYDLSGRLVGSHTTTGAATERTYGNYSASTPFAREIAYDDIGRVSKYKTLLDNGATTMEESFVYGTKASGEIDYVKAVKLDGAQRVTYAYDSFGRVSQRAAGGVPTTYTYEAVGTAGRTTNTVSSMTTGGDTLAYTYDANGNILTIKRNGVLQESYTYDSLNQLTRHDSVTQGKSFNYVYDKGGNITAMMQYAYTTGALGTAASTTAYGYGDSVWADLLTSYGGTAVTYDTIGNPLTYRSGMTMAWTNGRRLASIGSISGGGGIAGGGAATFSYNAAGQRTSKTAGGVTHSYVWDGSTLVQEKWGSNSLIFLSDASGGYYGFKYNGSIYYYVFNLQGDVIAIVNNSGVAARYSYDAWGKPVSITDGTGANVSGNASHIANVNPIRYRGYYYDNETGLYYCQSRYYDPVVGRWINADEQLNTDEGMTGYNMFQYCGNNPVVRADISGKSWIYVIWKIIDKYEEEEEKRKDEEQVQHMGRNISIGGGWTIRIDPANPSVPVQRHIHIFSDNEMYSQNKDGSPHDGSSGRPPNWVIKQVKKEFKWDWDKKDKEYKDSHIVIDDPDAYALPEWLGGGVLVPGPFHGGLPSYSPGFVPGLVPGKIPNRSRFNLW